MRFTTARAILLTIATVVDEIDDWMELVSSPTSHYFRTTRNRGYFRGAVEEHIKVGNIEKKIIGGKLQYRLKSKGVDSLYFDFPIFRYMHKKWDGLWTFVSYDIEEELKYLRNKLWRKLKELTFGQYQRSIWITPHPVVREVSSFIDAIELSERVHVYRTKQLSGNPKKIAWKAWKLEELEKKYSKFNTKWANKLTGKDPRKIKKEIWEDISKEYAEILITDPGLPKDLLPRRWEGYRAGNLINWLRKK
jgi:phenylacetic acid degradation operon negative regulatory protein